MAKGQQKGNKEIRKPKQVKPAKGVAGAEAPIGAQAQRAAGNAGKGKPKN